MRRLSISQRMSIDQLGSDYYGSIDLLGFGHIRSRARPLCQFCHTNEVFLNFQEYLIESMALLLEGERVETIVIGSRLVHSGGVGSVGDLTSNSTPRDFHDYTTSSTEGTPQHSPSSVRRTSSLSRINHGSNQVMSDRDKGIYNALGSSSSPSGKVSCIMIASCMLTILRRRVIVTK